MKQRKASLVQREVAANAAGGIVKRGKPTQPGSVSQRGSAVWPSRHGTVTLPLLYYLRFRGELQETLENFLQSFLKVFQIFLKKVLTF